MQKKKEIITNYRKRLQELDDVVIRSKVNLLNQIKKETLSNLIRLGEGEFEALELLEKLDVSLIKCHKCGSTITCSKC
jgi:hypothetical protein